ncbi:DUF6285 domain-containing protein [Hyphomonas sp. FCG-A18]|uniref:DUF6285 domain-containing protein n=1 Tax=Hyphomonas sp. FCG-A18 TaxID=3080019 RepID=UPI002B31D621|nr:DUF6285 domain-containing protein [Hyphomonas sp. FCG-A18]
MHDQPSVSELIAAVKHFIDETAAPNLSGHAGFHARVASNALATVLRDLKARVPNDMAEAKRLRDLLSAPNTVFLAELNRNLCDRIRSGEITPETPGLLAHLKATTMAQVEVDQPRYSGLKTAKEKSPTV